MNQSNITDGNQSGGHQKASAHNIVEAATAAGVFTTLLAAIRTAGMSDTLSAKGPFTVFAPTDEAFKRLPAGALEALLKDSTKLSAVLRYHVVAGQLASKDVKSGDLMTLQGTVLVAGASSKGLEVNGAKVKQADIVATNGVIHAIDAVIMPKKWELLASAA